jgi:hypothetical protein
MKVCKSFKIFFVDFQVSHAKRGTDVNMCEYEAQNHLGCTAMFLIEFRPTFQRYVLPPSS